MAEYDALGPAFNIFGQLIGASSQAGMTQKDIADSMGSSNAKFPKETDAYTISHWEAIHILCSVCLIAN